MDNIISKLKKLVNNGDEVYSPLCGNISPRQIIIAGNEEIVVKLRNGKHLEILLFDEYGRYRYSECDDNTVSKECLLLPSEHLRDWSKVFDIGDVIVDEYGRKGIFGGFGTDKSMVKLKYRIAPSGSLDKPPYLLKEQMIPQTCDFIKVDDKAIADSYRKQVEEMFDVKLTY